jgi:tol-pal system protein YbgF
MRPVPAINCDSTYDESFIQVRQGEYESAAEGFALFIANCGDHENIPNAHYWMGESYYALQKYDLAITRFETVVNEYKTSKDYKQSLYKIARCQEELGDKTKAKQAYQRVVDELPGTFEAEQAAARLKDL